MPQTAPIAAVLALVCLLLGACASDIPAVASACQELTAGACSSIRGPVCARRDTGIRCIRAPCDSVEYTAMATACAACADPRVDVIYTGSCADFTRFLEQQLP